MRKEEKAGSLILNPFSVDMNTIEQTPLDTDLLKFTFKNEKEINNLKYIIKDILSGDSSAAKREEYSYLNFKQIQTAIKFLMESGLDDSMRQLLLEKPYLLTFKDKPPSPEEFLGEKYIGAMAESVWYPVRKAFIEYFDPLKPYRTAALNPSIGAGKPLTLDTKIWKSETETIENKDIQIGDKIQNPDGTKSTVIGIQPQGKIATYKIKFSNGETIKCGIGHLWKVSYRKDKNYKDIWETVTTEFIIQNKNKYKFKLANNKSSEKYNTYLTNNN